MSSEVQEGLVAFFEFEEVTDLPEQSNARHREHTILLTLETEGGSGKELGRAGPFKVERQLDGHLCKVDCHGTQAVLPVFQGGKSRLRVVLHYDSEPIGATEPFSVTWDASTKPQIRHYQIVPFSRSLAKNLALTRVHMAHKLIREKSNNAADAHKNQGQSPHAASGAFALLQLDMLTDLPGTKKGYFQSDSTLPNVVITVEPAYSHDHSGAVTAGSFPTKTMRGTNLREADLQQHQVRLPVSATSTDVLLHILAWSSSKETGHLELLAVTDPISVSTQYKKDAYYPLRSQPGHAVKGKISISHQLIRDQASEHAASLRSESRKGPVAYLKFDHLSDLPGPRYGRGVDRGSEGRVLLTVELPHAPDQGAELGRAGAFQTTAQAGGFLYKVNCRDATVTVEGRSSVCVCAWYLVPGAGQGNSEAMDLIGSSGPIDISVQASPVRCFDLHSASGSSSGRVYVSHLLRPAGTVQHRTCTSGPACLSLSSSTLGNWPQHVTQHLETPQGMEDKWSKDGSVTAPRTRGLRMVGAAWQIRHPHSQDGALESMFICEYGSAAGVGEIFNHNPAMDPHQALSVMMHTAAGSCERSRLQSRTSAAERASVALESGCEAAGTVASFAVLVAALDAQGKDLGIARLGDCVLWQIRKAPGSLESGGHASLVAQAGDPHRPPSHPVHDGPSKAEIYTFPVQEGDLLVLGTDGVFDNLFGQEVCELADWALSPLDAGQSWREGSKSLRGPGMSTEPQRVAAAVAHAAHHRACDKLASTPIASKTSRQRGVAHVGGKLDDITGPPVRINCDSHEAVLDRCEPGSHKSRRDALSPITEEDASLLLPFTCGPRRHVASHQVTKLQLIRASVDGNVPIIQAAIKAGANIEVRHPKNFSHGPDAGRSWAVDDTQVRTDSRPPAYFAEDDSVLHQTLSNEPEETVEFVGGVFRLQGAGRSTKDSNSRESGVTPLMLAARAGQLQAVMCLLQNNASPHAKDENDMRPLHYAATAGCRECCKALLRARASPTVCNDAGRDAFDCLPRGSTADELDRMQWAALLRTQEFHRWYQAGYGSVGRPPVPQAAAELHQCVPPVRMQPKPREDLGTHPTPIRAPVAKLARIADSADAAAGSLEGVLERVAQNVKKTLDMFPPDPGSVPVPRHFSKETPEIRHESGESVGCSTHPGETAAVVARAAALQQQLAAAHESKLAGDEQLRFGNVAAADRCYTEASALLQHASIATGNTTVASRDLRQASQDIFIEADSAAPEEKVVGSDVTPGTSVSRENSQNLLVCEEGSKDVAPLPRAPSASEAAATASVSEAACTSDSYSGHLGIL